MDSKNDMYAGMPEHLQKYTVGCIPEEIVIENFFHVSPITGVFTHWNNNLYKKDVGWCKEDREDAMSDDLETIFRFYTETRGYNLLFYWLKDGCIYNIANESLPVTVCRFRPRTNDPTIPVEDRFGEVYSTCGVIDPEFDEIIASFDGDNIDLWNQLKINGVPIGEVLEQSVILATD